MSEFNTVVGPELGCEAESTKAWLAGVARDRGAPPGSALLASNAILLINRLLWNCLAVERGHACDEHGVWRPQASAQADRQYFDEGHACWQYEPAAPEPTAEIFHLKTGGRVNDFGSLSIERDDRAWIGKNFRDMALREFHARWITPGDEIDPCLKSGNDSGKSGTSAISEENRQVGSAKPADTLYEAKNDRGNPADLFTVATGDPRFDPGADLIVNGFRFVPVGVLQDQGEELDHYRSVATDAWPCVELVNWIATASDFDLTVKMAQRDRFRNLAKEAMGDESFAVPRTYSRADRDRALEWLNADHRRRGRDVSLVGGIAEALGLQMEEG